MMCLLSAKYNFSYIFFPFIFEFNLLKYKHWAQEYNTMFVLPKVTLISVITLTVLQYTSSI